MTTFILGDMYDVLDSFLYAVGLAYDWTTSSITASMKNLFALTLKFTSEAMPTLFDMIWSTIQPLITNTPVAGVGDTLLAFWRLALTAIDTFIPADVFTTGLSLILTVKLALFTIQFAKWCIEQIFKLFVII